MDPPLPSDSPGAGPGESDGDSDDAPWIFVSERGRRRPPRVPGDPCTPPQPTLTSRQIAAQHAPIRARWRAQPSFQHLMDLVRANAATHAPITRAVCLGTGSFDPAVEASIRDRINQAHVQTDAFLAMVDVLSTSPAALSPRPPG